MSDVYHYRIVTVFKIFFFPYLKIKRSAWIGTGWPRTRSLAKRAYLSQCQRDSTGRWGTYKHKNHSVVNSLLMGSLLDPPKQHSKTALKSPLKVLAISNRLQSAIIL